jgi:hypothetical protein
MMLSDSLAKRHGTRRSLELPTKRELAEFVACYVAAVAFAFGIAVVFGYLGLARADENPAKDRSQWAQSPPERQEWFRSQIMNDTAQKRLNVPWKSCCDNGDVFRTRFRVGKVGEDVWEYLDGETWKVVPPDIIKDNPSLDSEPILFRSKRTGVEYCFFKPNGGI